MAALALIGATGEAAAAAFYIQDQSVQGMGRAHAGNGAIASDASTIFFNPAGMTELKRAEVEVGGYVLLPRVEFENRGSTAATPGTLGAPLPYAGNDGGDPTDPVPVANLYLAYPTLNGRLWFGLGVTAPFGLDLDYNDDWFGRYDLTETELTTINIGPTVAYKFNDYFSIGAGVDFQYADAALENAIPDPLQAGGPTAATDGKFAAEGNDWSVGFNAGVLIKPSPRTRIGLHYRSYMSHDIEGEATISGLTGDLEVFNGTVGATAELNLPDIVTTAVAHELSPRLTLLGHVAWFGWERFDELRIKFADGSPDQVRPANYDNSWAVSLGAEYELTDAWTLRSGLQYDETPTVDGFRDTGVPDGDRYWIAFGATYKLSDRFEFDLSYAHLFVGDGEVDLTRTFFATIPLLTSTVNVRGTSENSADFIAVQVRMRF